MKRRIGRLIGLQGGNKNQPDVGLSIVSKTDISDNPDDLETLPLCSRPEIDRAPDDVTVHVEIAREAFAHQRDFWGIGQIRPCHIATAKNRDANGGKKVWRHVLHRTSSVSWRAGDEGN